MQTTTTKIRKNGDPGYIGKNKAYEIGFKAFLGGKIERMSFDSSGGTARMYAIKAKRLGVNSYVSVEGEILSNVEFILVRTES